MSRRRKLKFVLVPIALIGCVIYARAMFWMPAISSHRGDGRFENISRRAGPFALPGYSVSMPEFDLGNPQQAEYRFGGLPNIGPDCGVYLAIHDPDYRWSNTDHVGGRLKLELLDLKGRSLVTVSGRLGDFIWWGFGDMHALYKLHQSSFRPDSDEEYLLKFSYEPDPALAGQKGFVYLRSGGSK